MLSLDSLMQIIVLSVPMCQAYGALWCLPMWYYYEGPNFIYFTNNFTNASKCKTYLTLYYSTHTKAWNIYFTLDNLHNIQSATFFLLYLTSHKLQSAKFIFLNVCQEKLQSAWFALHYTILLKLRVPYWLCLTLL